jgi:hypothetical protein
MCTHHYSFIQQTFAEYLLGAGLQCEKMSSPGLQFRFLGTLGKYCVCWMNKLQRKCFALTKGASFCPNASRYVCSPCVSSPEAPGSTTTSGWEPSSVLWGLRVRAGQGSTRLLFWQLTIFVPFNFLVPRPHTGL